MKIYNYKTLKELLNNFIRINDLDEQYYQSLIEKKWVDIIGISGSKSIEVIRYKKGTLYLKTHSSTWKAEILLRKNDLINKLNDKFEKELVKEIIIH